MSICNLGLSCEPIKDDLSCCKHFVHSSLNCEICEIHKKIIDLTDMYKELSVRIIAQHEFKLRQIDENVKLDKKVNNFASQLDEIENGLMRRIGILGEAIHQLSDDNHKLSKSPHKCPACDGKGYGKEGYSISMDGIGIGVKHYPCSGCDGKGIVWSS